MSKPTVLELCAGGGGQALGLEMAGFAHSGVVEYEPAFCTTLRSNRPHWNVVQGDIRNLRAEDFTGSDIVAAGVPCPPFSVAGKQLGADDERDMFPTALKIVSVVKPRAVLFENVPGLATARFADYRMNLFRQLAKLGYMPRSAVLHAMDFGVPQLRPRFVIVALRADDDPYFSMPAPTAPPLFVGDALADLMEERGWQGADDWARRAQGIAPTVVGGSKKHGGPDLGPTRAKRQWAELGVDGLGIADEAPAADFPRDGNPRLTVRMVARVQGFPDSWVFSGRKTIAYRQVGNAFPPPVAKAIGEALAMAFARRVRPGPVTEGARQLVLLEPKPRSRRSVGQRRTA
ncbi:MAG: DNA (cytosine-5-)-methyltransferase [Opitutaceae bacterium]|nr:DNA (cytosine-5-)-methyltransferase [Opitutaceae bacterium]